MKNKKKIYLAVLVCLLVILGVAAIWSYNYYVVHKKPNFAKNYVLYVYPGMPESEILDSLECGAGMINRSAMEKAFESEQFASRMKPGKYQISTRNTSIYVARMLTRGWQIPHRLTLSGTMRNKGVIAKKIANQMMVDSTSVAAVLNDKEFLAGYGFTPEDVFGMILPDTYEMYWTATIEEIFDRLKQEYDAFWTEERLAKAKQQKLTPKEVSVAASIVSGETNTASEYAQIAGVYLTRLKKGMKLQADPTVCFCYDYKLDRVLKKHLTVDSPYTRIESTIGFVTYSNASPKSSTSFAETSKGFVILVIHHIVVDIKDFCFRDIAFIQCIIPLFDMQYLFGIKFSHNILLYYE